MPAITKREFLIYTGAASALLSGAANALAANATGERAMKETAERLLIRKTDNLSSEEIYHWLVNLRGHPFVGQSGFDVTSVFKVKTKEDEIYYVGGVNVENTELTAGTCGEEGAIAAAVGAFGQEIDLLEGWVMGAPEGADVNTNIPCYPCGECRQRIAQYMPADAPVHIIGLSGDELDVKTREELLPNAFSFRDLEHTGPAASARQLAPVTAISNRLLRQAKTELNPKEIFEWLNGLQPDVRVSNFAEAVVLKLKSGAYVAGVKIENAAYPSSTNAMQSAAAIMNTALGDDQKVTEVWSFGRYNAPDKASKYEATFHPLSGSSLQILKQFTDGKNINVHMFNSQGEVKTAELDDALLYSRTFENPHPTL